MALATFLSACGFDPAGSQAWEPPEVYRTWWTATEACSGLSGRELPKRLLGSWAVDVETQDGQLVGRVPFIVRE